MSVRLTDDGRVELYGDCSSADAETLMAYLAESRRIVDWRTCEAAHAAVVQVLLVSHAEVLGPPAGAFLRQFVDPALKRSKRAKVRF
jgi:hypothetical protein